MKNKKFRVDLSFTLTTHGAEKLDKSALIDFKEAVADFIREHHDFYAYSDNPDGSYDTNIAPANFKFKVTKIHVEPMRRVVGKLK